MSEHEGRTLTDEIIAALENADILVGDGVKPSGGGWQGVPGQSTFVPYVVVHPTAGGQTDGPIDSPDEDATPDYTTTAIGATRAQCEWVTDLVFKTMLAADLTPAGRSVALVRLDFLPGAFRDDDVQPPVWFAPTRWRIFTTPS